MLYEQAVKLSQSEDPYVKDVYTFISKSARFCTIAGDSEPLVRLTTSQCEELSQIGYEHVKANYVEHGITFETPSEARQNVQLKIMGDTLYNAKTGVGTLADPSVYTHSQLPIMIGPYEGTSVYAPGGLPAIIIDKKSRAMVLQGASFKSLDKEFWNNDKIEEMEFACAETGFNDVVNDAVCDAFIYGGAVMYPVFEDDAPSFMKRDMYKYPHEKGCITRWVETDRWNVNIVPNYTVTAADYLRPKTFFIPQSSLDVSTSRTALVKPKTQPYWISLYNIGWSPSDMSGWLRSYYGYEITCQSIPVMAQQMSLILYRLPLDALNATIGADKVRELMKINEEKMTEWSAVSPKAVNMVGEVEVVNRTYSGFDNFIGAMKSDLAAQCGIPEPSLWHTPNKGFSDNTTESLLKQSETLRMTQAFLERSLYPCKNALIAHVYGTESEEWEKRDKLKITFDKPVVSTEKDLAEAGARFAASISSLTQSGVSPDIAMEVSQQFFPNVKITDEILTSAKKSYDEYMKAQQQSSMMGGGFSGNKLAVGRKPNSPGGMKTTGHYTKA